jgi:hypothetical protein
MRNTRIRTLGLALVAVFALSVVTAATASALPTLPELVNSKGEALVKKKYKSTSGKSTLENTKSEKITCKEDTDEGETTGLSTSTSTVKFKGCESSGVSCKTSGASSGEIVTSAKGTLEWINEKEQEVGLLLETEKKTITCLIIKKEVEGSVLGIMTPVNKLVTPPETFSLAFKQKKGVQEPSEYEMEGKKVKVKTTTNGVESGLETTDALTFEEAAELR